MLAEEQHQAYQSRIEELRRFAALDGFSVNKASESDFWSFLTSMPFLHRAGVILMETGICELFGAVTTRVVSRFSSSATDR